MGGNWYQWGCTRYRRSFGAASNHRVVTERVGGFHAVGQQFRLRVPPAHLVTSA